MSFLATVLLTGVEPGGGEAFFSGFFTLEFSDVPGARVPADVWGGGEPLIKRRLLDLVPA